MTIMNFAEPYYNPLGQNDFPTLNGFGIRMRMNFPQQNMGMASL
jgi:hypothetical protein